jgi:hypothetical protein
MRAELMIPKKRYKTKDGRIYIAWQKKWDKRPGVYLVKVNNKKNSMRLYMPYDYEVEHISRGQDRLSKEELDNVISNIKSNGWSDDKKTYIKFLINGTKCKLYIQAQRVLTTDPLPIDMLCDKRYKNGYYSYKVKFVKDLICPVIVAK